MSRMSSYAANSAPAPVSTAGGELLKGFSSLSNRLTDRLKEGGLGGVGSQFDNLISGVKNFLPARTAGGVVTRLVEALMDPTSASAAALHDVEDYVLLDSRQGRARPGQRPAGGQRAGGAGSAGTNAASAANAGRATYSDAIVFLVGGGSYVEYTDLVELCARSAPAPGAPPRKRITYGATEVLRPAEFLSVLGNLA